MYAIRSYYDLGLANVDVLLGLAPQHTLFHLFHEQVPLESYNFV